MTVCRIHMKTATKGTYEELFEYCINKRIIGVGWKEIDIKEDDYYKLREQCHEKYEKATRAFKAINAIRQLKEGDLIWARQGGGGNPNYYLCRVGKKLWKDREITLEDSDHDMFNYVSCEWKKIGTEDQVPGCVVNSFRSPSTVQRIRDNGISEKYWLDNGEKSSIKFGMDDFWKLMGSEEIECLVLLYLQSKGYYIITSTMKKTTRTFECIMVKNDGSHKCFPQVKQDEKLEPYKYIKGIEEPNKVFLFSSSEEYGEERDRVECIMRKDLELFLRNNYNLIPDSIKKWYEKIDNQ